MDPHDIVSHRPTQDEVRRTARLLDRFRRAGYGERYVDDEPERVPLRVTLAASEAKFRAKLAKSGRAIRSKRVTPQPRRRTYPVGYTLLPRGLRRWFLVAVPVRSRHHAGFGSPTRSIPNDLERQRIRRAQRAARRINRSS